LLQKNLPFPLRCKEYFFLQNLDKRPTFRWLKSIPFSFFFFLFFSPFREKILLFLVRSKAYFYVSNGKITQSKAQETKYKSITYSDSIFVFG